MLGFFLAGFLGGSLRGVLGVLKTWKDKKRINYYYFASSVIIAGILGLVIGSLVSKTESSLTWEVAFLFGYAGTDFIEGLQKAYLKNLWGRLKEKT